MNIDEFEKLKNENLDLKEEIERLNKVVEGHKKAVRRWKLKADGVKGYNKKSSKVIYDIKSVNLIINDVEDFKERLLIETDIPASFSSEEAKEIFSSMTSKEIFPENDGEDFIIKEINKGSSKDVWSMIVVR